MINHYNQWFPKYSEISIKHSPFINQTPSILESPLYWNPLYTGIPSILNMACGPKSILSEIPSKPTIVFDPKVVWFKGFSL